MRGESAKREEGKSCLPFLFLVPATQASKNLKCQSKLRKAQFAKNFASVAYTEQFVGRISVISNIIIQPLIHCPNMVKKLSMYVGPHDVYPTIDVNFSILTRECKNKKLVDNIFSSNFVLLSMC